MNMMTNVVQRNKLEIIDSIAEVSGSQTLQSTTPINDRQKKQVILQKKSKQVSLNPSRKDLYDDNNIEKDDKKAKFNVTKLPL